MRGFRLRIQVAGCAGEVARPGVKRSWPHACVACKPTPVHPRYIRLGFNASCVHDTPHNAALTGRASLQAQKRLEWPQPSSGWSSVQIWHKLRLRELDGLFIMEAAGG